MLEIHMTRDLPSKDGQRVPSGVSLYFRIRQQIRRRIILFSGSSAGLSSYRGVRAAMVLVLFTIFLTLLSKAMFNHTEDFDDIRDMKYIKEEDKVFLERKRNETKTNLRNPLTHWNTTDIKLARMEWDYIYGEFVRKTIPPVLTKYKSRLLRKLLARARYNIVTKKAPNVDVSCNSLNDINDSGSPHTFRCAPTSHQCPDGGFFPRKAFVPQEGSSVTWCDIVIIIMVSAGRESLLEAAADTWISRLPEEATLLFVGDNGVSPIPERILNRRNTFVHEYVRNPGLKSLDLKSFVSWSEAYNKFGSSSKRYFLKLDDDAFLVGHHFIHFLNKLEYHFSGREEALYFGHPFCGYGDLHTLNDDAWCYAGGGVYGMSIEALQIFVTQVRKGCSYLYDSTPTPDNRTENNKYSLHYEDVVVGRCLRLAQTRTQEKGTSLIACGSFFPYAPLDYFERLRNSQQALSDKMDGDPITLHNLDPSAIRFLNYLLYKHPLGGFVTSFSAENELVQELVEFCYMASNKMVCKLPYFSTTY